MDNAGCAYGLSPDLDGEPNVVEQGWFYDLPNEDEGFAIFVVQGELMAVDGGATRLGVPAGFGVFWDPGERWQIELVDSPVHYFQVEGTHLRPEHFA